VSFLVTLITTREVIMYRRVSTVCATIVAVFCAACGSENAGESDATVESTGARVVLQDRFSENGVLTVVEDEAGVLSLGIQGKIGVDDDKAGSAALSLETLEKTYVALHPEAPVVPANVRALSTRLQAQRALEVKPTGDLARTTPQYRDLQNKDSAAFYANACKKINGSFEYWNAAYCSYQVNWHAICTYSTISSYGPDKSIAWNESPYNGKHSLSGMSWQPTIPAWNWYVTTWGGTYSNRYACLTLDGSNTGGNLGITSHSWVPDPH